MSSTGFLVRSVKSHLLFPPFTLRFFPSPFARRDCFFWSQSLVCGGDARACAPPAIKQTQAPPTKITTRLKAQQLGANPAPKFARSNRRQGPRDDRMRETQRNTEERATEPELLCGINTKLFSNYQSTCRLVFTTQATGRDRIQGGKNIPKADPACGDDVCIVWQAAYKYIKLKPPGDQHTIRPSACSQKSPLRGKRMHSDQCAVGIREESNTTDKRRNLFSNAERKKKRNVGWGWTG